MDEHGLELPDGHRREVEKTDTTLLQRAARITARQGGDALLVATQSIVGEWQSPRLLEQIVEAASALVAAGSGSIHVSDLADPVGTVAHQPMRCSRASILDVPCVHYLASGVEDLFGGVVRVSDVRHDRRFVGWAPDAASAVSLLDIALRVRQPTRASLYLFHELPDAFTDDDAVLVQAFALTAGPMIDAARSYAALERAKTLSSCLLAVSTALVSYNDDAVDTVIAGQLALLIDTATVAVLHPGNPTVVFAEAGRSVRSDELLAVSASPIRPDRPAAVTKVADPGHPTAQDRTAPVVFSLTSHGPRARTLWAVRDPGEQRFTGTDEAMIAEFGRQLRPILEQADARSERDHANRSQDRERTATSLTDHVIHQLIRTGSDLQTLASQRPDHADALLASVHELDTAVAQIRTAVFSLAGPVPVQSMTLQRLLDTITEASPPPPFDVGVTFSGAIDRIVTGDLADDVIAAVHTMLTAVSADPANGSFTVRIQVDDTESEVTVTVTPNSAPLRLVTSPSRLLANLIARAETRNQTFRLDADLAAIRASWHVPAASVTVAQHTPAR